MTDKFIPYGLHEIGEEDIQEVVKVLHSKWITSGPLVKDFEDKFCEYIGCKYAVAVNSGTSALDIAVASLGMTANSEVITTPFSFAATSNCILYNNLQPVFVDIKPDTYNINPDEIEKKITPKTKAIIYVDFAGQPCEIERIKEIAEEHNLYLIEDAAHSLGAKYNDENIGNLADLTTFSFHPVKHITTGEGGMVTTNNAEIPKKIKMLRNHGIDKDARERLGSNASFAYDMSMLGRNYRITDFQCALGISQLKKLDGFIKRRDKIAREYEKGFQDISDITTPYVKSHVKHAWHLYTILLDERIERDKFFTHMREKNIGVNVHYIPTYKFTYYKKLLNIDEKYFPVTENIFKRIISLPLYPKMSDIDIKYVIKSVKECIEKIKNPSS